MPLHTRTLSGASTGTRKDYREKGRESVTLIGTNTITAETETATTTTQEAEEKTLGGEKNYVLYT